MEYSYDNDKKNSDNKNDEDSNTANTSSDKTDGGDLSKSPNCHYYHQNNQHFRQQDKNDNDNENDNENDSGINNFNHMKDESEIYLLSSKSKTEVSTTGSYHKLEAFTNGLTDSPKQQEAFVDCNNGDASNCAVEIEIQEQKPLIYRVSESPTLYLTVFFALQVR